MKITAINPVVVNAELRNWVFIKVTTDQPGLIGWGEATLEWKTQSVVGAIKDLEPLLIGADPRRLEHLWQSMYRHQFFQGGIVTMTAISGIDQALHDITAKAIGVPLYQLLGGAVRSTVRMYDHLGGGDSQVVYGAAEGEFAEAAMRSVEDGFSALKILAVPMGPTMISKESLLLAESRMRSVREAVGPNVDIMVDLHGRTTPAMAIQYGHVLAPYSPWFLEEPCQPGNFHALAEVARALAIPIATGERVVHRYEFHQIMEARGCAVIQPDICHVGGFTEIRKIAALAEMHQVSLAPHNPLGPIATAASLQFAFSSPNHLVQEVMRSDVPWRDDVVTPGLPIIDGHVQLPDAVGLGIEVNETEAAKHPYRPEPGIAPLNSDGSVRDW
jgi:galactonate dehydratase